MKKWILFILLVSIGVVSAKAITLAPEKSYEFNGKNITLLRQDDRNNNAVFCVNGIRQIIEEDKTKIINEVSIELKTIKKDK